MTFALSGTPQASAASSFSLTTTGAGKFVVMVVYITGGGSATAVASSNVTWDASPRVAATAVGSGKATVFTGVATGSATATVTVTTTGTVTVIDSAWQEMTTTAGYASVALRGSAGTSVGGTFSSMTAVAGDAYVGFAYDAAASDGSGATSGYTYGILNANTNIMGVNPACAGGATFPAVTGSDSLASIAILLKEVTVTATTFPALVPQNNANVRKALKGGVIIGPTTATLPAALTATSTPVLQSLTGWTGSLGWISDAGAVVARNVNTQDILAWGDGDPVRTDITSKKTTVQVNGLESNKIMIATYFGVDPATLTADATTGEVVIADAGDLTTTYYRVLVLSQDGAPGSETWIARLLPRASITNYGNMVFMSGANAITYDVTFTAYLDATAGYSVKTFYAGPGWLANKTAAGF